MSETATTMYSRSLFRDSLLYIPTKVLPALTTILFITFLFRTLSPAEYIVYSVVLPTSLIIVQFSTGWIGNAVLYYLPQVNDKPAFLHDVFDVLRTAGSLGLLLGVVAVGFQYNNLGLVVAAALQIAGQMAFYSLSSVFQSERLIGIQLRAVVLQCLVQLFTLIILFFWAGQESAAAAVFSYGLGFGLTAVYYVVSLRKRYPLRTIALFSRVGNPWGENQRMIARYGLPLGAWFCATLFINSSDRFFLKNAGGAEQAVAGYLSSKDLLVGVSGLVAMPLLMASHPLILRLAFDNRIGDIEKLIRSNIRLLAIVFATLLTVMQFFGFHALRLILGNKYEVDTGAVLIVVVGLFFSCAAIYAQKGLEVEKKTALMAVLAITSSIFAIPCNVILIRAFGIRGAASAFCASFAFYFVCVSLYAHKYIRVIIKATDIGLPLAVWGLGFFIDRVVIGGSPGDRSLAGSSLWLVLYLSFILLASFTCYKLMRRPGTGE